LALHWQPIFKTVLQNKPAAVKVAVIGLGYVGLPLALQLARRGMQVIGIDLDPARVQSCNSGRSYLQHVSETLMTQLVTAGAFAASTSFDRVREVEAILICVPTPLTREREPDLSSILRTAKAIAPHLPRGCLVVLESTTYPGTTEEELRPVLEKASGLTAGQDFHLAYSPEREDPGNPLSQLAEIPKVVGGLTPACLSRATALYQRVVKTIVPVSSCRVAEATKLLENVFRSVNIALVNELKIVYAAMGIDIWEVIAAAKTKPFGFMPFEPGPGLGGHCIPIDPFYLAWKARQHGQRARFVELAGEINTQMPERVVQRLEEALRAKGKELRGRRVLLVGLAYKANVDDQRESPTLRLFDLLQQGGSEVAYYDPHIPIIKPTCDSDPWAGTPSVRWEKEVLQAFDAAIIATAHDAVNYQELADWCDCIVDTRNAMAKVKVRPDTVWKA
jgi:UDP-N-acetyl-D-glucosamine dehydrogenase